MSYKKIITDIHSISPASGWYFLNDAKEYEEYVCFALVTILEYEEGDGRRLTQIINSRKAILGLAALDFSELIEARVEPHMEREPIAYREIKDELADGI